MRAHVSRETYGKTRESKRIVDAESNILDEQGEVDDYAAYFREARGTITEAEGAARSLTGRAKGRMGFLLGTYASDDLYSAFLAGRINTGRLSAERASAIADTHSGRGASREPRGAYLRRFGSRAGYCIPATRRVRRSTPMRSRRGKWSRRLPSEGREGRREGGRAPGTAGKSTASRPATPGPRDDFGTTTRRAGTHTQRQPAGPGRRPRSAYCQDAGRIGASPGGGSPCAIAPARTGPTAHGHPSTPAPLTAEILPVRGSTAATLAAQQSSATS